MKIASDHIETIKKHFAEMQSKEDFVDLLNKAKIILWGNKYYRPIELKSLNYYANPEVCKRRYTSFSIKKKTGEDRIIQAPVKKFKSILRTLNFVLQCVFEPHPAAYGFAWNKNIVDNAKKHVGKNYVFNIDLKDFFHSFDRNRVKLALMDKPFNLNNSKEQLAFFISSLCTHPIEIDGEKRYVLPQGSPTSPTLTNIICQKLDRRLNGLAKRFGAHYSRYADDITFSSDHNIYNDLEFLNELKRIIEEDNLYKFKDKILTIGPQLKINEQKVRLQKSGYRQEATGLVVNEKVNVRRTYVKQIRMWIYYWEKYGYEKAEKIFKKDYIRDKGHVKNINSKLENVLLGKLLYLKMVKGETDETYKSLNNRFHNLIGKKENLKPTIKSDYNSKKLNFYDNSKCDQLKEMLLKLLISYEKISSSNDIISSINTDKRKKIEIHNPIEVYKILRILSADPVLKFTTHSWDSGKMSLNDFDEHNDCNVLNSIEIFISAINDMYSSIYKIIFYNSKIWWEVIYPFIFQKNLSKKDGREIPYRWGACDIKQGWQYPTDLIEWCKDNYDNKDVDSRKSPMLFPIKEEVLTVCAKTKYKRIFGREIQNFSHLVDLFKREIEFRDDTKDLYYEVLDLAKQELVDIKLQNEKELKKINTYAYTYEVLNAIRRIFKMVQARPENNHLKITCSILDDKKVVEFIHVNSLPYKNSMDTKFMKPSGDLEEVINSLFSNAHFEIESRFPNGNYCIKYLYDGEKIERINNSLQLKPKIEQSFYPVPEGFIFRLIFPTI